MIEKEELRKKIKQLKYKIQKEEGISNQLNLKVKVLRELQRQDLGIERILKKIRFKLQEKGMNISDWLNSITYEDQFNLNSLIVFGERLGFDLDREQTNLFLNFMGTEVCPTSSEEFKQICSRYGFKLD